MKGAVFGLPFLFSSCPAFLFLRSRSVIMTVEQGIVSARAVYVSGVLKSCGAPVYDAFRHALPVVDDDWSVIAYLYGNRCGVCMNIHRQLQIKAFLACVSRCGGKYAILRDFIYYIVNQLFTLFRALICILPVGGKGSSVWLNVLFRAAEQCLLLCGKGFSVSSGWCKGVGGGSWRWRKRLFRVWRNAGCHAPLFSFMKNNCQYFLLR